MWKRYWTKEITFLIVVIININVDSADVPVLRDDKKLWVATPAHMKMLRIVDTTWPDNEETDNQTTKEPSKFEQLWGNVISLFKPEEDLQEPKHDTTDEHVLTVCFAIATTYMGALKDLRRHFSLRYFYANNMHYEIGYMTSEIIHKYQRMLEIYYIAQTYYFENQNRSLAPPTYMLYLYTNVLEMGTVIAHQCNMLEELEDKFKVVPDTGFGDYHLDRKIKSDNGTAEYEKILRNYERKLMAEKKKRERERRKLRQKNLYAGFKPTTPQRKPSKGRHFPLSYGWSIEFF